MTGHPLRARGLVEEVLAAAAVRGDDNDAEQGRIAADVAAVHAALGDHELAARWRDTRAPR